MLGYIDTFARITVLGNDGDAQKSPAPLTIAAYRVLTSLGRAVSHLRHRLGVPARSG